MAAFRILLGVTFRGALADFLFIGFLLLLFFEALAFECLALANLLLVNEFLVLKLVLFVRLGQEAQVLKLHTFALPGLRGFDGRKLALRGQRGETTGHGPVQHLDLLLRVRGRRI